MYQLDTQAARKADTAGATIREIGKYIGEFTQAVDIKTAKGGRGVSLVFKSNGGQKANLAIYTTGANGDKYQGFDTLMAILTCMRLRGIKPVDGHYMKYDYDTKQEVKEAGKVFPELCGPIGVLLETEDYEKQDGSVGTRMVLKNVFDPATEFTASEILDKKTKPEALAKMVVGLRHRPIKGRKPSQADQYSEPPAGHPASGSGFEGMDESDIPFITSSMYFDATTSKERRISRYDY